MLLSGLLCIIINCFMSLISRNILVPIMVNSFSLFQIYFIFLFINSDNAKRDDSSFSHKLV
jgi:hypothetical protein